MMAALPQPGQPLTRREIQILRLVANGHTYERIAGALGIKPSTVLSHMRWLIIKLEAENGTNAVALALLGGILDRSDVRMTSGTDHAAQATQGALQRLHSMWRRTIPPRTPDLAALWWRQRLDELANIINKDCS